MAKVLVSMSATPDRERITKLKEQVKALDKAHTDKVKTLESAYKTKRKALLGKLKEAGWKPPVKKDVTQANKSTDPLAELSSGLGEVGIKVGASIRGGGHKFSFKGEEKAFVTALKKFMAKYNWVVQNKNWFPGDPGDSDEPAYFIKKKFKDGTTAETSLDFSNKVLENIL